MNIEILNDGVFGIEEMCAHCRPTHTNSVLVLLSLHIGYDNAIFIVGDTNVNVPMSRLNTTGPSF